MSANATLQKPFKYKQGMPTDQPVEFVIDGGAYRYVCARLRIDGISGTGSITIKVQHAVLNDESEYKDLITFTSVANTDSFPNIQISTTETFARFLRWQVSSISSGLEVKFSIELVLKN
jgi:hypothetical protein